LCLLCQIHIDSLLQIFLRCVALLMVHFYALRKKTNVFKVTVMVLMFYYCGCLNKSSISLRTKVRIYMVYILPVLYCCDTWTVTKQLSHRTNAFDRGEYFTFHTHTMSQMPKYHRLLRCLQVGAHEKASTFWPPG